MNKWHACLYNTKYYIYKKAFCTVFSNTNNKDAFGFATTEDKYSSKNIQIFKYYTEVIIR